MKVIFFDLSMGAAGDMISAALFELLPPNERQEFISKINKIGIPNVSITPEITSRCGICGTLFSVKIKGEEEAHIHTHEHHHNHTHTHEHTHEHSHGHHHHASMAEITHIISHLKISPKVKEDVTNIYQCIAEAESAAHGCPVSQIHFHEVGMMDAIADITCVCMLMELLSPDKVISTPIHVGNGTVKCAHGIMPVPAPATANILKGIPIYSGDIMTELCTPTGAALIRYFTDTFESMPLMSIDTIGYGLGSKDFDNRSNSLRAVLGTTTTSLTDRCILLSCNIDDMTGEDAGYAIDMLMQSGAKDAFYEPIICKKSRPGLLLSVITDEDKKDEIVKVLFKYTSTIGIRQSVMDRYILDRTIETVHTRYGDIRRKISTGYGVTKSKWESDDIAKIATHENKSISDILKEINQDI